MSIKGAMNYSNSISCMWEVMEITKRLRSNCIVFIAIGIIPTLLTILLNVVFMVTLIKTKSLHKPSNVFLGALCVSDVIVGVMVQPIFIAYNISITMENEPEILRVLMQYSFAVVSGLSLTFASFVTADRYFAICHPFQYQEKASCKRYLMIACISGFCYAAITVITFMRRWYQIEGIVFSYLLLSFIGIIASYLRIYRVAAKKRNAVIKLGKIGNKEESRKEVSSTKKESAKTFMVGVILCFLLLCYMPFTILYIISMIWRDQLCKAVEKTLITRLWAQILVLFNSCINPFIYFILRSEFRSAAKCVIRSCNDNSDISNNSERGNREKVA